ncbi:MAG: hypothetical protein ACLP0J_26720 [Solirubrobacteraceae bacterium]
MQTGLPTRFIGALATGPPAFLLAGLIDVARVTPLLLALLWRSARARRSAAATLTRPR